MQQCFQTLQNRMDIIEEAIVKFSSLEAKICDEITDFKKEVLKEIKKMGTKPTNHSAVYLFVFIGQLPVVMCPQL
jgi:chloramphenicol O-acetyltransferase